MTRRCSKDDENKVWQYVHVNEKPCPSGAEGTSRKHNKKDDNELPDLPDTQMDPIQNFARNIVQTTDVIDD